MIPDDSDFIIPIKALKEKIEQQNNGKSSKFK